MNVNLLLKQAKKRIDFLDSELILLSVLGEHDRSFLTLNENLDLKDKQEQKFMEMLEKREKGVPLAYLLGYKEFFGQIFFVSPDVLIPRPESESIIEFAKELTPKPKRILDVGTGSGCLAISLKLEIPDAVVFGSDLSKNALEISRKNAKDLRASVKFLESDLLDKIDGEFDLVVANLPYVSRDWKWTDGIDFEPETALFAEDGGLFLIKKLIRQVKNRTRYLILESDISQQDEIVEFAEKYDFSLVKKDNFVAVFQVKTKEVR